MTERDHPWFSRRITTLMITAAIGGGAIIGNLLGFLGPVLLSPVVGIAFTTLLVTGSIGYAFWAMKRVHCPECSSPCEGADSEQGKSGKVICRRCQIIWDLGVSFRLKDE